MQKCPQCGRNMIWEVRYVAGQPVTAWKCVCGYDTSQQKYYFSDHTEQKTDPKISNTTTT